MILQYIQSTARNPRGDLAVLFLVVFKAIFVEEKEEDCIGEQALLMEAAGRASIIFALLPPLPLWYN